MSLKFPHTSPSRTIADILTQNMFSPPWTESDRQAVIYIDSLSDQELVNALITGDKRLNIRSASGRFVNPLILAYLEIERANAFDIYRLALR